MAPDHRPGAVPRQGPFSRTSQARGPEVVRWPFRALLLPMAPLLLFLLDLELPQRQPLLLVPEQAVVSRPFRLDSGWLGSPRLELTTTLPADSSAVFSVDLLNDQGQTVLELSKEAWRETGTWFEDGETGTYDEADAAVPLDLRPVRGGDFRLRVTMEELLDAAGRPLATPLMTNLSVRNHSLDGPLILASAVVGGLMVALLWRSVYGDCRYRRVVRVRDGGIDQRIVAGGAGVLRLKVRGRCIPRPNTEAAHLPRALSLRLRVDDRIGRRRLDSSLSLPLAWRSNQEIVLSGEGLQVLLLRIGERDSLRLRVEESDAHPDGRARLEWLELVVEDGVACPWEQDVRDLSLRPAASLPPGSPGPESRLILGLALAAVVSGSVAALTRPGVYRLGQEGTPVAGSGVRFIGSSRAGRWRHQARPANWSRFPGRGPGSAK